MTKISTILGLASYLALTSSCSYSNIITRDDFVQQLYGTTGEPKAQIALRSAIQKVEEHSRELLAKLSLPKQQELIGKIARSQAVACNFLTREASSSALNDTERSVLSEKATACQDQVNNLLRDQLLELRQKKM